MDLEKELAKLTYNQLMALYYLAGADDGTKEVMLKLIESPNIEKRIHAMHATPDLKIDLANRMNEYVRILGRRPYDDSYEVEYTISDVYNTFSNLVICYTVTVWKSDVPLIDIDCRLNVSSLAAYEFGYLVKCMDDYLKDMWKSNTINIELPYIKRNCESDPITAAEATVQLFHAKAPHRDRGAIVGLAIAKSFDDMREHAKVKNSVVSYILHLAEKYKLYENGFAEMDDGIVVKIVVKYFWSKADPIMLAKNKFGEYYKSTNKNHSLYRRYIFMRELMKV